MYLRIWPLQSHPCMIRLLGVQEEAVMQLQSLIDDGQVSNMAYVVRAVLRSRESVYMCTCTTADCESYCC